MGPCARAPRTSSPRLKTRSEALTDRRLLLALITPILLASCGGDAADEGAAPTGEVLEGTISDAMLPIDRVQSEPPLADPEAFQQAQSKAAAGGEVTAPSGDSGASDEEADSADEEPGAETLAPEAE